EAATAYRPRRGVGEHARLAVVRRDDAGRGVGTEVPLVPIGVQAGPVPVGRGSNGTADALRRRVDRVSDRGADAIGADDDPGAGVQVLSVTGPSRHARDLAVLTALDTVHRDAEVDVCSGSNGRVDEDRVQHGASGRVEGIDAVRRLDGDRHHVAGVPERRTAYGWGAGGN